MDGHLDRISTGAPCLDDREPSSPGSRIEYNARMEDAFRIECSSASLNDTAPCSRDTTAPKDCCPTHEGHTGVEKRGAPARSITLTVKLLDTARTHHSNMRILSEPEVVVVYLPRWITPRNYSCPLAARLRRDAFVSIRLKKANGSRRKHDQGRAKKHGTTALPIARSRYRSRHQLTNQIKRCLNADGCTEY